MCQRAINTQADILAFQNYIRHKLGPLAQNLVLGRIADQMLYVNRKGQFLFHGLKIIQENLDLKDTEMQNEHWHRSASLCSSDQDFS